MSSLDRIMQTTFAGTVVGATVGGLQEAWRDEPVHRRGALAAARTTAVRLGTRSLVGCATFFLYQTTTEVVGMMRNRDDAHNRTVGAGVAGLALGARGRSIAAAVATSLSFAAVMGVFGIFDYKIIPPQTRSPPITKPSSSEHEH